LHSYVCVDAEVSIPSQSHHRSILSLLNQPHQKPLFMQLLLRLPVNQRAVSALLTPFYFLFQSKKLLLRLAMLVMSVGMMSGVVGQATVTSDQPDYAPRTNAVFTGSGFQAFEQVQLKVKNLNRPCNTVSSDSSYLPWTIIADVNGAFVTNWTVCDCPGDSLRLKAMGLTSGLIAYAYFSPNNSAGIKDFTTIVGFNNSAVGGNNSINNFNIRIRNSINTLVWVSSSQNIANGSTYNFIWDGTYSVNGLGYVPDGVYTAIAANNTNESSSPSSITKQIIVDNTNPIIIVPENIVVVNNTGVCGAVVSWNVPTVTDANPDLLVQTAGPVSGSIFPVGTTTVTYEATDAAGNNSAASFTVTVNDTEAPVIAPVSPVVTGTDAGVCEATVVITAPAATDNCLPGTATGTRSDAQALNAKYPKGVTTITWTYSDGVNNAVAVQQTVTVNDTELPKWTTPTGSLDRTFYCGQLTALSNAQALVPLASDNCGGAITISKISGSPIPTGLNGAVTYTNTWIATDAAGNISVQYVQTINVLGITVDANASTTPVPINTAITLKAYVNPANVSTAGVTVYFYVDNVLKGTGVTDATGLATSNIGSLPSEVYQVKAIAGGGCSESLVYLPVYDPNGGFVTGGGWINSPAGAYVAGPLLTGKANFGFVAKYKKGSTQVDGNTEFQFHVGNFNFKSTVHDAGTLVIAGSKATYRGTGTVNGAGNYGFLVTGIDGQITGGGGFDMFRIKIWDKNNGNEVVYDNEMGLDENGLPTTVIAGGSIVIHDPKKKTANRIDPGVLVLTPQEFGVKVFGNPALTTFRLQLQSNDMQQKFTVKVVDINGRLIEVQQNLYAGQVIELGGKYTQGTYFAEVMQGTNRKVVKLIKIGRD
jgi:hypothetical protein